MKKMELGPFSHAQGWDKRPWAQTDARVSA